MAFPTIGCIAYYNLDEGTGTSISDATGNGHSGLLQGSTSWVAGHVGAHALSFSSATSDYVDISNNPFDFGSSDTFSLTCWLNWVNGSGAETVIGKHSASGNSQGYSMVIDRDNFRIKWQILGSDGSVIINLSPISSVPPAGWHHIVVTYDGSSSTSGLLSYVDGSLVTGSLVGTLTASPSNTALLKFGNSAIATFLNGNVDKPGVWNVTLTSGEVTSLYNGGAGLPFPISTQSQRRTLSALGTRIGSRQLQEV